jgi:hypothetical protein
MKLLVVIVNYRVTQLTIACLHSLASEINRVPGTYIAVCENGTGQESAKTIQNEISNNNWGSWCALTVLDTNMGFTGGNNAVIRPALASKDSPDYFLLLNADTIVRPNAIKILVDFMDNHPRAGIAGSRLEDPDGTPQRSAFRFQTPISEFERSVKLGAVSRLLTRWITAPPVTDQAIETDWVAGASIIIRRQVFIDIGVLDEGYFTYFDDIDFCFNARKAGWLTWYVPTSRVVHLVGQTTGVTKKSPARQPAYVFEARRRYFLKNYNPAYAALADAALILGLALRRARLLFTCKEDLIAPYLLRDTIRHSVFVSGFKLEAVKNPALQSRKTGP